MRKSPAGNSGTVFYPDQEANEAERREALGRRCREYKERLRLRDPRDIARLAAMELERSPEGETFLRGWYFTELYQVAWPGLTVVDRQGNPAPLSLEVLWLHYLDRADGHPLAGRWVNLSQIGGLFYQQAFQGYTGDRLARAWAGRAEEFTGRCRALGGWPVPGLGGTAFRWQALPRLPVCVCFRERPAERTAWAAVLFDAAAAHYVAADVAATVGSRLTDCLLPGDGSSGSPRSGGTLPDHKQEKN